MSEEYFDVYFNDSTDTYHGLLPVSTITFELIDANGRNDQWSIPTRGDGPNAEFEHRHKFKTELWNSLRLWGWHPASREGSSVSNMFLQRTYDPHLAAQEWPLRKRIAEISRRN